MKLTTIPEEVKGETEDIYPTLQYGEGAGKGAYIQQGKQCTDHALRNLDSNNEEGGNQTQPFKWTKTIHSLFVLFVYLLSVLYKGTLNYASCFEIFYKDFNKQNVINLFPVWSSDTEIQSTSTMTDKVSNSNTLGRSEYQTLQEFINIKDGGETNTGIKQNIVPTLFNNRDIDTTDLCDTSLPQDNKVKSCHHEKLGSNSNME